MDFTNFDIRSRYSKETGEPVTTRGQSKKDSQNSSSLIFRNDYVIWLENQLVCSGEDQKNLNSQLGIKKKFHFIK